MKDITFFGWLCLVIFAMLGFGFFYAVATAYDDDKKACKERGWDWIQGKPPFCSKPGTVIQHGAERSGP